MMNGNEKDNEGKGHSSFRDLLGVKEVLGYFFRRKDPARPSNFNIRAMHWINKISILIFLVGVIFIVLKRFF